MFTLHDVYIYIYSTCIGCQAVAHRPGLQIQVRLDQLFIEEARGWFNTIKIYFAWYGLGSKDLKFLAAQAQHFVNNMEETPVSHLQPDIYCIYIVYKQFLSNIFIAFLYYPQSHSDTGGAHFRRLHTWCEARLTKLFLFFTF